MKSFILLAVIIASTVAAPAEFPAVLTFKPDGEAVILRYETDNTGIGGYSYGYETSNGIAVQEEARLVEVGTEEESLVVHGEFSYPSPNGVLYTVTYTADRNGFVAQGFHLPNAKKI